MRVAFRVDASLQVGNGHVMRCLTLAQCLQAQGAQCAFISRPQAGDLFDLVRARGFVVHPLAATVSSNGVPSRPDTGVDWALDAAQTRHALDGAGPFDWLVVDHYRVDHRWEAALQQVGRRLMVIDDLADRRHVCDLLLDQNLGRQRADYAALVPAGCVLLAGPAFALIEPVFAQHRARSLAHRPAGALARLLVSMGGVDASNATGRVLSALAGFAPSVGWRVDVVMGPHAPALQEVRQQARGMPAPTTVHVGIAPAEMAELMAACDLAIGGAGGTAWERCCLGLPTLLVVLAENQRAGAQALVRAQAARMIGGVEDIAIGLPAALSAVQQAALLARMSAAASAVADGQGVQRVAQALAVRHG